MSSTAAPASSRYHLTITTPSGRTEDRSVAIDGTLTDEAGAPVAGTPVAVDEAGVELGTASTGADGRWSVPVSLPDLGVNALTARALGDASGAATSAPVVLTLGTVLSPTSSLGGSGDGAPAHRTFPARDAEVSGEGGAFTFVFRAHPGHAVVDGLALSGAGADRLSLPQARFDGIADVLRHTAMSGGDAVIHLSPRDSVTLVGVTKAALRAHPGAVLFHG